MWLPTELNDELSNVEANLDVLISIKPHNKLCIVANGDERTLMKQRTLETHKLNIDQRMGQWFKRYMSNDSRQETIAFIKQIVHATERLALAAHQQHALPFQTAESNIFIKSPLQVLHLLNTKLELAIKGIESLCSSTYLHDQQTNNDFMSLVIAPARMINTNISRILTHVN